MLIIFFKSKVGLVFAFTACLQQKKIAELLSIKEINGKGYIPQCDLNGNFKTKQCSINGKICWCVDSRGVNLPQSLGPAESVNCDNAINRKRGKYGMMKLLIFYCCGLCVTVMFA